MAVKMLEKVMDAVNMMAGRIKKLFIVTMIKITTSRPIILKIHETILARLPFTSVHYQVTGKNGAERCTCCGGIMEITVKGKNIRGKCAIMPGWNRSMECEHYERDTCECKIKTCRGTENDRMTGKERFQMDWIALKCIKSMEIADRFGYCIYIDNGFDSNTVIWNVVECGYNVVVWNRKGEYPATIITKRGSVKKMGTIRWMKRGVEEGKIKHPLATERDWEKFRGVTIAW